MECCRSRIEADASNLQIKPENNVTVYAHHPDQYFDFIAYISRALASQTHLPPPSPTLPALQ